MPPGVKLTGAEGNARLVGILIQQDVKVPAVADIQPHLASTRTRYMKRRHAHHIQRMHALLYDDIAGQDDVEYPVFEPRLWCARFGLFLQPGAVEGRVSEHNVPNGSIVNAIDGLNEVLVGSCLKIDEKAELLFGCRLAAVPVLAKNWRRVD